MTPEADRTRPVWMRLSSVAGPWISVMMLALSVAIIMVAFLLSDRIPGVESLGYPAVFLISLFGNATLIVPVPAFAVVCTGGTILHPLLVGILGGTGQALGEMTGYIAGFGGQGFFQKGRYYQRINNWVERRGWVAIVLLGLIPNPLFDFAGLAAGALRMPAWKFLTAAAVGKTIRSVIIAYGCAYGIDLLGGPDPAS